jgi:hypothetical protein
MAGRGTQKKTTRMSTMEKPVGPPVWKNPGKKTETGSRGPIRPKLHKTQRNFETVAVPPGRVLFSF